MVFCMPDKMKDKLIILDKTLRDGEQNPGAAMTREMKIRIACKLEKLRVVIIEAGFSAATSQIHVAHWISSNLTRKQDHLMLLRSPIGDGKYLIAEVEEC